MLERADPAFGETGPGMIGWIQGMQRYFIGHSLRFCQLRLFGCPIFKKWREFTSL